MNIVNTNNMIREFKNGRILVSKSTPTTKLKFIGMDDEKLVGKIIGTSLDVHN
jgi:hypothetical protein